MPRSLDLLPPVSKRLAAVCVALLVGLGVAYTSAAGQSPRALLIRVRDTPPEDRPNFLHERDGSYTVSTGSGGDRDERAGAAANATVVSTSNSIRLVHVREGESVRVDLPSVQSLQFHVPMGAGGTPGHGSGASPAPHGQAPAGAPPVGGSPGSPGGPPPAASGVVYFEGVAAFAARFALVGRDGVRIDLVPLQVGAVEAPFAVAGGGANGLGAVLFGRVGQWIALGDTELASSKTLNATAEPPAAPSVWVRVDPDPAGPR